MENFDLNKGYVIRNFKVSVQSVDHEDLSDWLQDGRSSPIYFKHLLAVHPNLKRYVRVSKHDPTPEHVVKLPNSKLLMVRTVTLATGVTITNYNQTGQYRTRPGLQSSKDNTPASDRQRRPTKENWPSCQPVAHALRLSMWRCG